MFSAKTDLGDRGRVQNDLVRDIDPTGEEASRGEHVLAETDGAGRRDHVGVNDGAGADVHCGGSVPRATSLGIDTRGVDDQVTGVEPAGPR